MGSTSSTQIQDGGTSQRKASVVVSSDIAKNALVVANADGTNILSNIKWDNIAVTYGTTTDVYTFTLLGTTTAVITFEYSDTTKEFLSLVTKA